MPPYWRNERACDMTLLALRDVLRACNNQVAFRVKADIERQAGSGGSVANDPKRRLRNVCYSAAVGELADICRTGLRRRE
jgi:hypothetical protein